jgi:hypothetical protein
MQMRLKTRRRAAASISTSTFTKMALLASVLHTASPLNLGRRLCRELSRARRKGGTPRRPVGPIALRPSRENDAAAPKRP